MVLDRARLQQRKIKLDRGTSSSSSRSMNYSLSVGNQFDQGMIEGLFSEASNASQDDTAEMLKIEGGLYICSSNPKKSMRFSVDGAYNKGECSQCTIRNNR